MKNTNKPRFGTSFHDTVFQATVNTLIERLGEPEWADNTGRDKVNYEWVFETDNGDVFTIYDWKEYRSLDNDEIIEWHIGGKNKEITETAKKEIVEAVGSAV